MGSNAKTREELLSELVTLRARVAELERAAAADREQQVNAPRERRERSSQQLAELDQLYDTAPIGLPAHLAGRYLLASHLLCPLLHGPLRYRDRDL